MTDPVIKIMSYRISDIEYHQYDSKEKMDSLDKESKKSNVNMNYGIDKKSNTGKILMTAHIFNQEQNKVVDIGVTGFFKFRENIGDFEDKQKYLMMNGSAMLYPYLRATVSMIMAMDNPMTTILPSLNFVDQYNEFKNQENKE